MKGTAIIMKIQLAIDTLSLEEALLALEDLAPYIDIIEVGTPLVIDAGREAVRQIHRKFPAIDILCDLKIMDAGAYEARLAYDAGAQYVTVLGVTDHLTIKECVQEARKTGKKVVTDMICVKNLAKEVPLIESLGVNMIAVHTGVDQQSLGRTPIDDLAEIKKHIKKCQVAVAGGITSKTVKDYLHYSPDVIIIGSGILQAKNPVQEARSIFDIVKKGNH